LDITLRGYSGDEGEGKRGPPLRVPILVPAETTLAPTSEVVVAEAEAVVVEELKPNRRIAGRSTIRPRHAAARNGSHCERNAHVPKYRFRVPE
jgi:hypothetical protein